MQVRMLRGLAIGATAAIGLAVVAPAANAQAQASGTRFGVEAAYATSGNVGIGAGAFVKFRLAEISGRAITGRAAFDYYFPGSSACGGFDSCGYKYWELAADGLLDIVASGNTKPYVGAGLTYAHSGFSSDYCDTFVDCSGSSTGLHIVGGLNFMANAKMMPFVEAKIHLSSGSQFIIKGGIHF